MLPFVFAPEFHAATVISAKGISEYALGGHVR